ncbi:MAG: peptidase [Rhodospirillales bacterium]|nr:peptidase [Rhodospirillales bacterium]MBO6788280.1 peptidase [Rhodospirillales bacterium]
MIKNAPLAAALLFALSATNVHATDAKSVVTTYAGIAHAMYSDSLATAETLRGALANLTAKPSDTTLRAARAAWLAARVPYQQTEGYRFGNPAVDDWEGKVNAWPLDEGLIDYVDASYGTTADANPYYTANVIANPKISIGGREIDASTITPALLSDTLQELDGVEANVATGYHAIEFLLWGQDLNGTGPGAGNRPASDFDPKNCTNGNCDRRAAYLTAAADLLVSDLEDIVVKWAEGGEARGYVTKDPAQGIAAIFKGLGSLSYGELAGERIKLGLMLHDPEEEHDCFSDNTHNSHYYDQIGMVAIYNGRYVRIDGSIVEGPGLASLIAAKDAAVAAAIEDAMRNTTAKMAMLKATADARIMAYDQMLGEDNAEGNAMIQAVVDGLVAQAHAIEKAAPVLGVKAMAFEGSDSLDNPNAVFK